MCRPLLWSPTQLAKEHRRHFKLIACGQRGSQVELFSGSLRVSMGDARNCIITPVEMKRVGKNPTYICDPVYTAGFLIKTRSVERVRKITGKSPYENLFELMEKFALAARPGAAESNIGIVDRHAGPIFVPLSPKSLFFVRYHIEFYELTDARIQYSWRKLDLPSCSGRSPQRAAFT